ncbi:hypothetical protein HDK64DRAFT_34413 [Phyllosticta capitalensis]
MLSLLPRRPLLLSAAMAATREVVVLSSSPPRFIPDSDIIVTPPSLREQIPTSPPSSDLPSLPQLLKNKPNGLKSGSRAAEIPNGATLGFGSVASLLKDKRIALGEEVDNELPEPPPEKKPRAKAVRKPRAAAPARNETTERKARPEDDGNTREGDDGKASKPRKPRAKKVKEPEAPGEEKGGAVDSGSTLVHGEAHRETTAMAALGKRRANGKAQVTEPVSAHFSTLSTSDLAPTVEKAVSTVEMTHDLEPDKPKKPRGRSRKKEDNKPPEEDSLSTTETVAPVNGAANEQELVKLKKRTERSKKNNGDEELETPSEKAPRPRKKRTASDEKKQVKKAPKARAATSAVSAHFSRDNSLDASGDQLPKSPKTKPSDAPLDLDHAMERRRSWTPIRDSNPTVPESTSKTPIEITDSPANSNASSGRQANFVSLLGGFGYQQTAQERATSETRGETGEAFTKRRKIEMIPNPLPAAAQTNKKPESDPEKPEKEKAAGKKKPRTITELATAAYRAPLPQAFEPEPESRVSTFFAARAPDSSLEKPREPEAVPPEKPKRAPRQKKPTKASIEKEKRTMEKAKKQAKLAANKLLSPGAALLKYNNQEVLFGTSSQLVRDESPTFIRHIQQALKESELQGNSSEPLRLDQMADGAELTLLGKRKGLWTEAARNLTDEGLDVYDPGADEELWTAGEEQQFSEDTANGEAHPCAQPQDPSSDFVDIDVYDDLTRRRAETADTGMNLEPERSPPRLPVRPNIMKARPSSSSATNVTFHPAPRSMTTPYVNASPNRLNSIRAKSTLATNRSYPSGPTASESVTTLGTQKSVSLPATKRGLKAPPALPQGLISAPEPSLPEPQGASGSRQKRIAKSPQKLPQGCITPSPKRAGRKRAKQDEGWVHIDEIEDSGEEVTPSPPRRRKIPSECPKLPLSQPARDEDAPSVSAPTRAAPSKRITNVPSDEQMSEVFPIITNAIKAEPPSVQPGSLTWHEKILLYDPVDVVDLSEWLNEKGVRVHMEVAVKEKPKPKKRSKKAKADESHEVEGGDESTAMREKVEVKEAPLQPWVVQRWCEENSVCGIWKDNDKKKKGWKARSG